MAKKDQTETAASTPRFSIRIPGYSGAHPVGIRFIDNVGSTDDPEIALACVQQGFEVIETKASGEAKPV